MSSKPAAFSDTSIDPSSPQQRAKRLLVLREMTGLSRDKFHQRYGIARGTLQNWESARFGGLTSKGARTILIAFQAEGIQADLQWLLHGIGPAPLTQASGITQNANPLAHLEAQESQAIAEELLIFRNHNNDEVIDFVIPDDSMTPLFQKGDYVAGVRRYQDKMEEVVGLSCIVQTKEHGLLLRHVKQSEDQRYHLFCLNLHGETKRPCLYNVALISQHRSYGIVTGVSAS